MNLRDLFEQNYYVFTSLGLDVRAKLLMLVFVSIIITFSLQGIPGWNFEPAYEFW